MSALRILALLLVAAGGTAVVLTRDPRRQVLALALYGFLLTLLFMTLQAPDVAFSELAVGGAAVPLLMLAALAATSRKRPEPEPEPRDE